MDLGQALNTEDFLDSLMNHAPLGIISMDSSGKVTHANRLARNILQIPGQVKTLAGKHVLDCVAHIPPLYERIARFYEQKRKSFAIESIHLNDHYFMVKGVRIDSGAICIINDTSRMKKLETESILSIIAGQENERRRMGREIHDGIGPMLSYAKLELDAFLDEYVEEKKDIPDEKLQDIRQTLDTITNDLRDLSHHLIPRLLEEFGLFSAFSNLVIKINNTAKAKVEFYCNFDAGTRFHPDIELNLYRCGQELLHNAVKHAKGSEILVQVIRHEKSIVLMVEDDGVGFTSIEKDHTNFGIGLTNIQTRVRTLHGRFIVESRKDMGTSASIEIPIEKAGRRYEK